MVGMSNLFPFEVTFPGSSHCGRKPTTAMYDTGNDKAHRENEVRKASRKAIDLPESLGL